MQKQIFKLSAFNYLIYHASFSRNIIANQLSIFFIWSSRREKYSIVSIIGLKAVQSWGIILHTSILRDHRGGYLSIYLSI